MDFQEYLQTKNIDSENFKREEGSIWQSWKDDFSQMHPDSFTSQKLFLINPLRRRFPLRAEATKSVEKAKPAPRPVFKKPVTATDDAQNTSPEATSPKPKPVIKPKPMMKPKPVVKPKIKTLPKDETPPQPESIPQEKPKYRPKPIIKKRPKTD